MIKSHKNPGSFYQDRLGTNIGKVETKNAAFFRAEFWLEGSGDYDLDFKTAENDGT
jgi:hypothetical protein